MPGETAAPSEMGGTGTGGLGEPGTGGLGESASAGQPSSPAPNSLASAFGAASGPQSIAPNMIGDSVGNGMTYSAVSFSEQQYGQEVVQGNVPIAGGDRNFKIADNNSPIPTDRVLFNYHHFQNALLGWPGGQNYNLDRFTFGVEKTFCNKTCSVEVRVPFARGLEGDQELRSTNAAAATEFGNIPLVFKKLLVRRECWLLSAGMATVFPTGNDAREFQDGVLTKWVKNDSYHLQPFLGWLWLPNDQLFVEAFAQLDFDANGYPVIFNDPTGNQRLASGVLQDQSLMLVDLKIGRWIYRNPCAPWIKGIAPAVELHYTTTMQDADRVGDAANPQIGSIGNFYNRMDILNVTGGLHFALGKASQLTVAAVAPLRSDEESLFDAEVTVQYNRWF
jgi:hypothetical protein